MLKGPDTTFPIQQSIYEIIVRPVFAQPCETPCRTSQKILTVGHGSSLIPALEAGAGGLRLVQGQPGLLVQTFNPSI